MKLFLIILGVLIAWLGTLWGVTTYISTWAERGQFGDLFGSVNALFSGLAFAGLIYTIFLQKQELKMQREELKLQREEMQKSRAELAEQAKVQKAQFHAAISQLKADASTARIEAIKIRAEARTPGARENDIELIRREADIIESLANDLTKQENLG